jgi:hypothetical protein
VAMGGWGVHRRADLAHVAFLAGAAAAFPSFIDRRITKHTGNKESGARRQHDLSIGPITGGFGPPAPAFRRPTPHPHPIY